VINLLVPHFVRTKQNNSLASSARQTNFVNLMNSLNSSRINLSTAICEFNLSRILLLSGFDEKDIQGKKINM
jgi:hypothetical protein